MSLLATFGEAIDRASAARDVSFRSRLLHFIGCTLVGQPHSLGMPSDFWYLPGDRLLPRRGEMSMDESRNRIYVDGFRRDLTQRLARRVVIASIGLAAVAVVVHGGFALVHHAAHPSSSAWSPARCADARQAAALGGQPLSAAEQSHCN